MDDLHVVGCDQDRGAEAGDVLEQRRDLPGGLLVQVAGRLVGDQQRRLADHRPRDGHPLLLPSRELVGIVLGAVVEADCVQCVHRPLLGLLVGDPEVGHLEREGHVLRGGQPGQEFEVLEDHADLAPELGQPLGRERVGGQTIDPHLTACWLDLPVDQSQQGRLSRAARADEERQLARQQPKEAVVQSHHLPVDAVDAHEFHKGGQLREGNVPRALSCCRMS